MEVPVKQLLMSTDLNRVGGNTTNEVRGMGTQNQYRGLLNTIVVSRPGLRPALMAIQWLVFDAPPTSANCRKWKARRVLGRPEHDGRGSP